MEVEARLNDLGVVEHHQFAFGQILWQIGESVLRNMALAVEEELRRGAVGLWILGDALVGEVVTEVDDGKLFWVYHHTTKLRFSIRKPVCYLLQFRYLRNV